jgi:hypothetical protein
VLEGVMIVLRLLVSVIVLLTTAVLGLLMLVLVLPGRVGAALLWRERDRLAKKSEGNLPK